MRKGRTALIVVVSLLVGFALAAALIALIGPLLTALFFLALAVANRIWDAHRRRRRQRDPATLDRRWEGTTDELAQGYLAWCRLPDAAPSNSPPALAWEGLHELLRREPDQASVIMHEVANSLTVDEIEALRSLGSDALEELLMCDPPRNFVTFEQAALADARIAVAMGAASMPEPWNARLDDLRIRTEQPPSGC